MSKVIEHRRSEPGARHSRADIDGTLIRLHANADGVISIHSEAEQRVADAIGLRVTRVPKAEHSKPAKASTPEPEQEA